MIRVLIADDQALVRDGFGMILDAQPDMEVVGQASDGREAVEMARALAPDVVLMDIRMPEVDGVEATRRLVAHGLRSDERSVGKSVDLEGVCNMKKAGASGFLLKDVRRDELVNAVRAVAAGDALLASSLTRRFIEDFVRRPPPGAAPVGALADLTDREAEVVRLVARGLSNAEIADRMVVSEATVKTHVARVLSKLGLRDRTQVVVMAYETGFVRPGDGE